jgi:hypothetical protein
MKRRNLEDLNKPKPPRLNPDGSENPAYEFDLPHAYLEMNIVGLQQSDTLEDLLEGHIYPKWTNAGILSEGESKLYNLILRKHKELAALYEGITEGMERVSRVYEVRYIGPLIGMFYREDKREVRFITQLEAEFTNLLMHTIHNLVIRSKSWYEISSRLGIDMYRLNKLWDRYQSCIAGYDAIGTKSLRNLHYERCEYVLSRIMQLAEQENNIRSWLAVSKALEPLSVIVKEDRDATKIVDDEKKKAIERIKFMFGKQREHWIEEGKRIERKSGAIEVGTEMPPEFEEIGDI